MAPSVGLEEECSYSGLPLNKINPWEDGSNTSASSSFDCSSDSDDERVSSPQSSPSRRNRGQEASDYELKNARDALEGSTLAVINFLSSSGVSGARYGDVQREG